MNPALVAEQQDVNMDQKDLLTALGPLAELYRDPMVTDIMVDAPGQVSVEREGRLEDVTVTFESPEALRAVIDATLALTGVSPSEQEMVGEASLYDGSRIVLVILPTAVDGPQLVISKSLAGPLALNEMTRIGVLTQEARDLIESAFRAHVSLLVAGPAASGKTTMTAALAGGISAEERVAVVARTGEMRVLHPHCVHVKGDGQSRQSMAELVGTAAGMRPNWLVISELNGPEAIEALQTIERGTSGISSVHAVSPKDALARLETLCLMANLGHGLDRIRGLIASTFRLMVFMEPAPDGRRGINQIVELRGLEHEGYVLQPLFRHNDTRGELEPTGTKPSWE